VTGQQILDGRRVVHVAGRDDHLVDQLGVGVDRQVRFEAVEAAVMGLMSVAALDINGGDHPVGGDTPGDTKHPVVAGLDVLAGHDGQQLRCRGRRAGQVLEEEGQVPTGRPILAAL